MLKRRIVIVPTKRKLNGPEQTALVFIQNRKEQAGVEISLDEWGIQDLIKLFVLKQINITNSNNLISKEATFPLPRCAALEETHHHDKHLQRLNQNMLMAAAIAADWPCGSGKQELPDPDKGALRFRDILTSICDVAMPRVNPSRAGGVIMLYRGVKSSGRGPAVRGVK
ncbi:hypothetical protein KM043_013895 [Ampulex compressa]|nr:hypothetical protein KM043_013895 [Ampulex compressa]